MRRPLPSANVVVVSQGSICYFTAAASRLNADLDNRLWVQPASTRKANFIRPRRPGAYKQVFPSPLYNRSTQLLLLAATSWPASARRSLSVKAYTGQTLDSWGMVSCLWSVPKVDTWGSRFSLSSLSWTCLAEVTYLVCSDAQIFSTESPPLWVRAGPSRHPLRCSRLLFSIHWFSVATSWNGLLNCSTSPSPLKVGARTVVDHAGILKHPSAPTNWSTGAGLAASSRSASSGHAVYRLSWQISPLTMIISTKSLTPLGAQSLKHIGQGSTSN